MRIIVFLLLLCISIQAGPLNEYYVTDWCNGGISVIQGNEIIKHWNTNASNDIAIVVDDTIRTYGHRVGDYGAQYSLDGTYLGTTYTNNIANRFLDATTDGEYIYAWNYDTHTAYRFDLDWTNPQTMFTLSTRMLGITYDPTDNTLWLGAWGSSIIEQYSLTGQKLSSFSVVDSYAGALALDHGDGTLWYCASADNTFRQYSKTGELLETVVLPTAGSNYGGEFSFTEAYIPEINNLFLIALGLLSGFFIYKVRTD